MSTSTVTDPRDPSGVALAEASTEANVESPHHVQVEKYRLDVSNQLRRYRAMACILFATTCASTWLTNGWIYAAGVMSILVAHELGHYFVALAYRVPASPPLFIPVPGSAFGTMGAVIIQAGGFAHRRALFDIAICGPLAGLLVVIPATYFGLMASEKVTVDLATTQGLDFGAPLILEWLVDWHHGPLAANERITRPPLLFAAWVGIFITALNLMPVGQLDGGHILYSLIGRKAHWVAMALMLAAGCYMFYTFDIAYLIMFLLLLKMGPKHPPTADDNVELGRGRKIIGWLTLSFVIIGFTPHPIMVLEPGSVDPPQAVSQP
jgi:membrane-associated protease RseP (regulator of RpoE activity)